MKATALAGRFFYSLLFFTAAPFHFQSQAVWYATAQGVPLANVLVPASGVLALVGALSVLVGYRARWGAAALIAFLLPVTFMMHNFWTIDDPMMRQMQMSMFMKNLALIGGALLIIRHGAGELSLDARAERRARIGGTAAATA